MFWGFGVCSCVVVDCYVVMRGVAYACVLLSVVVCSCVVSIVVPISVFLCSTA